MSLKEKDPTWRRGRAAEIVSYNTGEAMKFLILRRRAVIAGSTDAPERGLTTTRQNQQLRLWF